MDRRLAFRKTPGYATASGCRCAVLPLSRFMARTPCPMPLDARRWPVHPAHARRTRPRTMDRKTPESGILGYTQGSSGKHEFSLLIGIASFVDLSQHLTDPLEAINVVDCPDLGQ